MIRPPPFAGFGAGSHDTQARPAARGTSGQAGPNTWMERECAGLS